MKRLLVLACIFALLMTGCAALPASSASSGRSVPAVLPAPEPTPSPLPRPTPNDPDEARLLALAEEAAGGAMLNHIFLDLDGDGTKELLGTRYGSRCNEVWYCSGDAASCRIVHRNEPGLDVCSLEVLEAAGETHVAVNSHVGMGTTAFFSILALRNGEIVCLVDNQPGNVRMTDDGDVVLYVETYDGMYEAASDLMLLHTVKDTYIFCDGATYKEYGAAELTEEEFSRFQNAGDLKAAIEHDLRFEEYDRLEYRYFLRPNGILQVQCDLHDAAGNISYGYYTVRWNDDRLEVSPVGSRTPGQMAASLSTLDVVY